jgi:hypothetical protein
MVGAETRWPREAEKVGAGERVGDEAAGEIIVLILVVRALRPVRGGRAAGAGDAVVMVGGWWLVVEWPGWPERLCGEFLERRG